MHEYYTNSPKDICDLTVSAFEAAERLELSVMACAQQITKATLQSSYNVVFKVYEYFFAERSCIQFISYNNTTDL